MDTDMLFVILFPIGFLGFWLGVAFLLNRGK